MSVSFRDPSGKVFSHHDQFYRIINSSGEADFARALKSKMLERFVNDRTVVGYDEVPSEEFEHLCQQNPEIESAGADAVRVLRHERIPFRSYPYEWTPGMLHAAAVLTLDLAESLLEDGMGLKDATPYNVLFKGAHPVFVDWLSFEVRDDRDPIWLAQSQFLRTFCLPLMAKKYFGIELGSIFRESRDGIEPDKIYKLCSLRQRFSSPFFSVVTLPTLLKGKAQNKPSIYQKQLLDSPDKARFVLSRQFKSLRKLLAKLVPAKNTKSVWSDYVGDNQHFTDEYFQQKADFVKRVLEISSPERVLDVGCNTGFFSKIAADSGARVVSVDYDSAVVEKVYQMARRENLNILPLAVDFSRPSPAMGWRNIECPSFIERASKKTDGILMLAVIHHLLVSERIPLSEIIELAAEIAGQTAIIEFVPPDDPMFKQIARGRDHLFSGLNSEVFRDICSRHFKIVSYEKLADSNREIYHLEK